MVLPDARNLPALLQIGQHLARNFLQGFKNSRTLKRDDFNDGLVFLAQLLGEGVHRQHVGQIALVELQHVRNLVEVVAVFLDVGHQFVESFDVGIHALFLRVGDENDAIDAAQDQLAAGVIENLAGNRIEVNASLEAANRAQVERQKIEEQGPFRLRRQRDHLSLLLFGGFLVDELEIRSLAAQPSAVVNDLAIDLAGRKVDETQDFPRDRWRTRASAQASPGKIWLGTAGFIPHAPAATAGYSGY